MNGLRVYTRIGSSDSDHAREVFYTRRESGPFYQWSYDQELATWHPLRVRNSEVILQMFNSATWKSLPPSLRARLGEHYLE